MRYERSNAHERAGIGRRWLYSGSAWHASRMNATSGDPQTPSWRELCFAVTTLFCGARLRFKGLADIF